ncbi:glycerate kinase [Sporosarcina aquimarina]|uniref:glycerate kinase n=1 Tax=Sporosarcina aquimarina TaxID=114975 RepID=UPI001C8DC1B1|nr:glycerate kinase [Sporosarcina aquimarina]MBY0221595.1 glycerate kinase [Sporosarcina aquimarina]
MKVVISPDSFKGSVTSLEAAIAIEKGIKQALPNADTVLIPLADGGEGTMDSLIAATNGRKVKTSVRDPLGNSIEVEYGWLGDKKTCVIEMASSSGICLIPQEKLDPMKATSFGMGELIKKALDEGCRNFILALGGSSTNDGGIGMLQALGMKIMNNNGEPIGFGGKGLCDVSSINTSNLDPRIKDSRFLIASDVQNPVIGDYGATRVFGPQKGATPEMVEVLEKCMVKWTNLIEKQTGIRLHDTPGTGAAGGIGGAFLAFFPVEIKRGIDIVIEYSGFKQALINTDIVITGEGQIDFQTASGKTPMGVAQVAWEQEIPTFVLTGSIGEGIDILYQYGIQCVHSIVDGPMTLNEAMERASELLTQRAEQMMRTYITKKSDIKIIKQYN